MGSKFQISIAFGMFVIASLSIHAYEYEDYVWHVREGHQYAATFAVGPWADADVEARAIGGNLVTINDAAENAWLTQTFDQISTTNEHTSRAAWIGMELVGVNWEWVNGEPVTYMNICGHCFRDPGPHMYLHTASHGEAGTWNYNDWHDTRTTHYLHGVIELPAACSTVTGWTQWPASEGGNDHWYQLTNSGDWDQAEAEAVAAGGHLVTINDSAENEWLYDTFSAQMSSVGAWIGFYQDLDDTSCTPNCESNFGWKWISGEPITFTGWTGQEPNNQGGGEDWAVLELSTGCCEWNDIGPSSGGYPVEGVPGIIERLTPPPTDWTQWPVSEGGNDHWYRASTPGTWPSAEVEAVVCGGHLVTINDADEQAWLSSQFPAPEQFWIGLVQDLDDPSCAPNCEPAGGWGWIDGTQLSYENWAGGEPNNNHPDSEEVGAMHVWASGLWADYPEEASIPIRGIIERDTGAIIPSIVLLEPGGSLNTQTIDADNFVIQVRPGEQITGSFNVLVYNPEPNASVTPVGANITWGEREQEYWTVADNTSQGWTNLDVTVNKTAPLQSGTYYIVIGTAPRFDAAQVMSATYAGRPAVWHDGNDLGWDWSPVEFIESRLQGYTTVMTLNGDDEHVLQLRGANWVKVQVLDCSGPLPGPIITPAATYTVTVYPLFQDDAHTVLAVFDECGQNLMGLRRAIAGTTSKTFEFSLAVGTYRFHAWSIARLHFCGGAGCASIPLPYYGVVDLTAEPGDEFVSGEIVVASDCDPGPQPGRFCDEAGDSDGDGAPDTSDGCPDDPFKVKPGRCGCGVPDTPRCR